MSEIARRHATDDQPCMAGQDGGPCTRCEGFQPTHGAYSLVKIEPRAVELADELRELVPARHIADEVSIRLLAVALAQLEAATTWLAENGIVDEKGNPRGIVRHLGGMLNTSARIADRLGMTPTSRAQLGLDLVRAKGEALRAHLDEHYRPPGVPADLDEGSNDGNG